LVALNTKGLLGSCGEIVFMRWDCVGMGRYPPHSCKSLHINDLGRSARRNPLAVNDLWPVWSVREVYEQKHDSDGDKSYTAKKYY
jgi:hypothetical protein